MNIKKIILLVVLVFGVTVGWYAFAKGDKKFPTATTSTLDSAKLVSADQNDITEDYAEDEKHILQEYQDLFKPISSGSSFCVAGKMAILDPADTTQSVAESGFQFLKKEDTVFYKTDFQKNLNTPQFFAVADISSKRMIVTSPKSIGEINPISLSMLSKNFKSEGYNITKETVNQKATIRFLNENNITCKEISVQFDQISRRPQKIRYRFTNLDFPGDKNFDKTVKIEFLTWEINPARIATYAIPRLVNLAGKNFVCAQGFEDYNIINLIKE